MNYSRILAFSAVLAALSATPAFAQTGENNARAPGFESQRDANQQGRIEQGLKAGQLNAQEASQLEKNQSVIDQAQARAMSNGKETPAEKNRIQQMQAQQNRDIYKQEHDAQKDNPHSAPSQRMEQDVKRDRNQEKRINNGVNNGRLTTRETGRLEHGQARNDRTESRADAHHGVDKREQARLRHGENQRSRYIHNKRHNGKDANNADNNR